MNNGNGKLSGLTIYRASAGSGKTFVLARDFISLVLKVPEKFRHILAVTFTNKATGEMKSRILSELYMLAGGRGSEMAVLIEKETGLSGLELQAKAKLVLDTILHNYSSFHIETIDRFFQRAIRAFTKEIGLAAGYRIELDPNPVLSAAIDELLHGLDQDEDLLEWIVSYARERIEEGKHWNLKRDIHELGKEINRERFQEKGEQLRKVLEDKEGLKEYMKEMNRIRFSWENNISEYAREALEIMEREGVEVNDFKYKSGGIGAFFRRLTKGDYKAPGQRILNSNGQPDEWIVNGAEAAGNVLAAYDRGLGTCLRNCIRLFGEEYRIYRSSVEIKKNLHVLGILNQISARMHEYTKEQGIFLLSDSPRFLYEVIDGNEAPFIYEKIGSYFHHYMIDEFQDTSSMQWKNFLPLVDNSLAFMRDNLVVGDVKQSIYRWRNSDWEILSEKIQEQFGPEQMDVRTLDYNWRSRENLVAFNNDLFEAAKQLLAGHFNSGEEGDEYALKVDHAYDALTQRVPDKPGKKGGYVHVEFAEAGSTGEWRSEVNRRLLPRIEMLQDAGIKPSDIAILVRTQAEGREIADFLLSQKDRHHGSGYSYDVISNDSLYLSNSSAIRLILYAFRYLDRPGDRINHSCLLMEYSRISGKDKMLDAGQILRDGITSERSAHVLPEGFYADSDSLKYLTLTELTENLITRFNLNKLASEVPYLLAFQDLILDYSRNQPADINAFIHWWDEHGGDKTLSVSEDQEAIRIMTIHKSKGLEFRAVIIPYCNWSMDHNTRFGGHVLWCEPGEDPFKRIPLLPVTYGSGLEDTVFRKDYREERFRVYIDHLNLMYVAMTRARDALIIYGSRSGKKQLKTSSDLLEQILLNGILPSCSEARLGEGKGEWTLGNMDFDQAEGTQKGEQDNINRIVSHPFSGKLRLKYRGMDFFDPESEKRINKGNLLHEVFSQIRTHFDVDRALELIIREGMIDSSEKEDISQQIKQMLQVEPFREWFGDGWQVMAENDILTREGALRRPDRVMLREDQVIVLDYKFGERKSDGHKTQVRQYMDILGQMGYGDVKGFLWYFMMDELVEI